MYQCYKLCALLVKYSGQKLHSSNDYSVDQQANISKMAKQKSIVHVSTVGLKIGICQYLNFFNRLISEMYHTECLNSS